MAAVSTVIGTPAWDRAWCLPLWFRSVRANVDPADTGLVFVVPSTDYHTREAIAKYSEGFRWVEILRDRNTPVPRESRPATDHKALAAARNQILKVVSRVQPRLFVSWDTDLLVGDGSVDRIAREDKPVCSSWTWLNRQPPRKIRHYDGSDYQEVLWQDPVCASAMAWSMRFPGRAVHYPSEQFNVRACGTWECGVTLAFQVMDRRAYSVGSYAPHHDGEDITFNLALRRRGYGSWCCADVLGVHLYDREARDETRMGWPNVMKLAEQRPLAAEWRGARTEQQKLFGFFPVRQQHGIAA